MKETAKALLSKNQNELSAVRTLYVFLDRADNVIEGGGAFGVELSGGRSLAVFRGVGGFGIFPFLWSGFIRAHQDKFVGQPGNAYVVLSIYADLGAPARHPGTKRGAQLGY